MSAVAVAPLLSVPPPVRKTGISSGDWMILCDPGGRVRWMNRRACQAVGVAQTVVEALHTGVAMPALLCFRLGSQRLWLGLIPDGQGLQLAERLRRANRSLWDVYCRRGTRNLDLSRAEGQLDAHEKRALRERWSRKASAEFVEAIELERGRVARELHDNAGQSLAGILLNLELAERQLGSADTEVLARLQRSRELASLTLEQIRRISHQLHPPEWQEQDFARAVEWLVDSMGLRDRLEVDPIAVDIPRETPPSVQTVLYRTLQEGLANVLRHADARRVSIEATVAARGVRLMLEDDGKGFDPAAVRPAGGIGLANMRRRVESLGGRLEIQSMPGKGARLIVTIPGAGGGRPPGGKRE